MLTGPFKRRLQVLAVQVEAGRGIRRTQTEFLGGLCPAWIHSLSKVIFDCPRVLVGKVVETWVSEH